MSLAIRFAAVGLSGLLTAGLLTPLHAQQVYRIVGPDGKVTFSDKPPADAATARVATPSGGAGGGGGALPFELRSVAGKYPVTLYSGNNCNPCGAARAFLSSRGIPFSERTVTTSEDIDALQRLSGSTNLPLVTIGGQQLKGFSEVEWSQFLDAAGYPRTSQLPAGYRNGVASPLVAAQAPRPAAAAPAPAPAPAQQAAPAPAAGPSSDNPAGIRF